MTRASHQTALLTVTKTPVTVSVVEQQKNLNIQNIMTKL